MSFWTAMVVIVAIWGFVQIVTSRRDQRRWKRRRSADGDAIAASPPDPEARREIEELRERIKVLEQITVDGREAKAIADEIERLRDK
ncbi:hypothetical protein [Pelagerythrobacter rhizovicinus]|uniref:Uncharacterized protein n=1 Tax=Pelagerythrobacter rhizovicinus TaxID=2268576 RepID=A0A4Q2KJU4_9SPHN|nr:hypothetical protein [Pelagerythrobacter rhizovicinus]RXZ65478.1 hypothetical protein ETX26_01590 [Pelagerythrobacter rhizovicinus]